MTLTTDTGRTVSDDRTSLLYLGPACPRCDQTEARCAFLDGCCRGCVHWAGYDRNGDELPTTRPAADELTARRRAKWRAQYRARTA